MPNATPHGGANKHNPNLKPEGKNTKNGKPADRNAGDAAAKVPAIYNRTVNTTVQPVALSEHEIDPRFQMWYLKDRAKSLEVDIEDLEDDIEDLENEIEELKATIKTQQEKLDEWGRRSHEVTGKLIEKIGGPNESREPPGRSTPADAAHLLMEVFNNRILASLGGVIGLAISGTFVFMALQISDANQRVSQANEKANLAWLFEGRAEERAKAAESRAQTAEHNWSNLLNQLGAMQAEVNKANSEQLNKAFATIETLAKQSSTPGKASSSVVVHPGYRNHPPSGATPKNNIKQSAGQSAPWYLSGTTNTGPNVTKLPPVIIPPSGVASPVPNAAPTTAGTAPASTKQSPH